MSNGKLLGGDDALACPQVAPPSNERLKAIVFAA